MDFGNSWQPLNRKRKYQNLVGNQLNRKQQKRTTVVKSVRERETNRTQESGGERKKMQNPMCVERSSTTGVEKRRGKNKRKEKRE